MKQRREEGGLLGVLLETLGASMLSGKGVMRPGKGVVRAGKGYNNMDLMKKNV